MRVVNRHTARVAEIAPGEAAEVDESNPGVKVFLEAGLLVDAATVENPEPELTLDQAKAKLAAAERLGRENESLRAHVADANTNALKFGRETHEARERVAEIEAENKHLAAVAETNASELGKAHESNRKLAARVAELEAQLAAKSEISPAPAPAAEPTSSPEAPAKKGKG